MPQDPAAALSALLRKATIDDHEELLNAANAALKADKNDATSQHIRVVALLNLDRFDDALRAIQEGGVKLDAMCGLEKTYALYKTGNLDAATASLKTIGLERKAFNHVAAQVAYRAERFDEARSIYHKLQTAGEGLEENDLRINIAATNAQARWQGFPPTYSPQDDSSDLFELSYNNACYAIASGSLDRAATLLQRATMLCDASDLTDEDKEAELQPILAQQAYVYARQGKLKESLDLYNSLNAFQGSESDLSIVAENNRAAMDVSQENPYLMYRKASKWIDQKKNAKLFAHQKETLERNNLVLDLKVNKINGVVKRTSKALSAAQLPTTNPNLNSVSVINAAAKAHEKTGKELTRALQDLARKRPNDIGLLLTVVQVQLQQGHSGAALSTLESALERLEDDEDTEALDSRFSPGLVALTTSLLRSQGRQTSAKNELVKAAKYWQDRPARSATSLLLEAGVELARSSNPQDLLLASSSFEKLFAENQGSPIAAAGLVASLAPSNPAAVQQHVSELPAIDALIEDVNVDQLLEAGVAALSKSAIIRKRPAPGADGEKQLAKKRRKRKLPKSYEEGKTADPERWLPLRDRSTYRPKGKKGKKKAAEATQGGVVKDEETLELVGGGGVKVEKSGGGSSSKKKKKGKK